MTPEEIAKAIVMIIKGNEMLGWTEDELMKEAVPLITKAVDEACNNQKFEFYGTIIKWSGNFEKMTNLTKDRDFWKHLATKIHGALEISRGQWIHSVNKDQ